MRIILFTGKGGVGKTTCAAATAVKAAEEGSRTLVISTDPAHSLSDALDVKLGPEPLLIRENLYAQELDIYYSMRKYWGNLSKMLQQIFAWQGMNKMLAEELAALPGMEEASAFLWIDKYYSEKEYDTLIIDSAPTGETLTLLTLPQVTKWWTSKLFPFPKFTARAFGTFVHATTGMPLDESYRELDQLFTKLEKLHKIFSDPNTTSVRVVVNPERMVIREAKRVYTYLLLYGYSVDSVIVNRVLPNLPAKSFFSPYLAHQKEYLEDIESSFYPLPVWQVPHAGEEVFGLEAMQRIGQKLYGERNPGEVLFSEKPFVIEENASGGYKLRMKLPFFEKNDFQIRLSGDELIITLGNKRRNLVLPKFLGHYRIKEYNYEQPDLCIFFLKNDEKS